MKKILLVEDDANLGTLLQDYLQLKGKFDVVFGSPAAADEIVELLTFEPAEPG